VERLHIEGKNKPQSLKLSKLMEGIRKSKQKKRTRRDSLEA